MQNFLSKLACCFLAMLLLSPTLFSQSKNTDATAEKQKRQINNVEIFQNPTLPDPTKVTYPWFQKPYLETDPEKATVAEMTLATERWKQANVPTNIVLKDDEFTKFQRKLYRWQLDGMEDERPVTADERFDAFQNYEKNQAPASQSLARTNNVEANWKNLGPNNNPDDIPFLMKGDSEESFGNAGLGRINCIEFSNREANYMWVGTSAGGVWETLNGGRSWHNISMNLPIMEISDIAIDQFNSNIIYVATGDRDGRGGWYGNGIVPGRLFKTTNGGMTWNEVVANFGTATFINGLYTHPERTGEVVVIKATGVYKSVDFGTTWQQAFTIATPSFFYLASAYADKTAPERMYLLTIHNQGGRFITWLNRSNDFGATWQRTDSIKSVINTPPSFLLSLAKIAVSSTNPDCVYLLALEADQKYRTTRFGTIARTLDGGKTWEDRGTYPAVPNLLGWMLGDTTDPSSQSGYNLVLSIDPKNRDRISVEGVDAWVSENGGNSFSKSTFWLNPMGESAHADHHWGEYSPVTGEYFLATDGGLYKTKKLEASNQALLASCYSDSAANAFKLNCYKLPTEWEFVGNGISNNEFYAIDVSKSNPDFVLGGAQDNSTLMLKNNEWYSVFGGDGFVPMIHPNDPNIFYATVYYGQTARTRDGGKNFELISLPMDRVDRGSWLTPMAMAETNYNVIFQARNFNVWCSLDAGDTWTAISNFPRGRSVNSTTAMAVAPSNRETVWVARRTTDSTTDPTSKRYLWSTLNGGTTWVNVWSPLFPLASITDIAIHPRNPNKVWVTFTVGYSATNVNQSRKVFETTDNGRTWTNITDGLPPVPVWTVVVSDETYDDGIYVGTGVGVFYRDKKTGKFIEYQGAMPRGVMVTDLKIHKETRRLYAGTHGRGIWRTDLYDNPLYTEALNRKIDPAGFLSVSPNPSRGLLRVNWDNDKMPVESLKVVDLLGKEIYSDKNFTGKSVIDLSAHGKGMFLLQLKTASKMVVKKVIIE